MKIFLKAVMALCLLGSTSGLGAQTYYGYSNGNVVRKSGYRFNTTGETQGLAIYIPAEKAVLLRGAKITGIRTALGTSQISNFRGFVTKSLGSEDVLSCALQTVSGMTSLKDYAFSEAYTVDGEAFYVGMTFEAAASTAAPLLFDFSNDLSGGLSYAFTGTDWKDVSSIGLGAPNLYLVLESAAEFADLMTKPVATGGYYKTGEDVVFNGQVLNCGTQVIDSFDLLCRVGAAEPETTHVSGLALQPGATYDFATPAISVAQAGNLPVCIEISQVNGSTDAEPADNAFEGTAYVYPQGTAKKVLLETFTGQACSNCPSGHQYVESAIAGNADSYVQIAHHSGYQPDVFTTEEDYDYMYFFYEGNQFYAPAAMFDRRPVSPDDASAVFATTDAEKTRLAAANSILEQPYVSIALENDYDAEARTGSLRVEVYTHTTAPGSVHSLNVVLTQSNFLAADGYSQSGAGGNWSHDHAMRTALTGSWGEQIELVPGQTLTKIYDYTIGDSISSSYYGEGVVNLEAIPENMDFVVFVGALSNDKLACPVFNVETLGVTDRYPAAIEGITSDSPAAAFRFDGRSLSVQGGSTADVLDMSGKCIGRLTPGSSMRLDRGLYVVRVCDGNGNRAVRKISVR